MLNFQTGNPFSAALQSISTTSISPVLKALGNTPNSASVIQAMERAGVLRTLAEPTLSAISGENATFLAGGEFPIPTGFTCNTNIPPICTTSVEFKKFGVSLAFTPIVLGEGRISLKVLTEVSDLTTDQSLTLATARQRRCRRPVPGIRVRRAETTVEIPSGGALALAGMLEEQTSQQINGFPGPMEVPILGALFRSRDYVNHQSELMIMVTPYIVRAVSPKGPVATR